MKALIESVIGRLYFKEINELYRQILQRPVDPSGLATYSRLMARGKLSIDGLALILRASEEFRLLVYQPEKRSNFEIDNTLHITNRRRDISPVQASGKNSGPVAATIASKRYLANARVTARSFRSQHPDIPFVLLLTDEVDGFLNPHDEPFDIWTFNDIEIPHIERFTFQYTELESSYAATPFLIDSLLESGFESVIFLKQETLILGELNSLFQKLGSHPFFVTPHMLGPSSVAAQEIDLLRAGVFNGGIIGASNTSEARVFLSWWMERTYSNCYRFVSDGLHYEQRWLDFLPALVPNVLIVRDPGVNVGHWNLSTRDVRDRGGEFMAQGHPLRVFRFSGFDPDRPERISRYSDLEVQKTEEAAEIFRGYYSSLVDAGLDQVRKWPYAYELFDNGVRIPDIARGIYRELGGAVTQFGDPRVNANANGSFFHWLGQATTAGSSVPRLWQAVYDHEPAIQMRFPCVNDIHSVAFEEFWYGFDGTMNDIPEELCPLTWRHR